MPYGDTTFGADHRWSFNNVLTDSIGSLTVTNTGGAFVATPITRDTTHSYQTNGRDDLATVATTTDTGSLGFDRYAFQGWFQVSQIQGPPVLIYKQGGNTAGFAMFMWAGNNVMLQAKDTAGNNNIQIYSDIALTNNRPYHFFVRYSGSGFSNEIEFYIDGRKQTSNRGTVQPGATSMTAHTGNHNWGENGTASIDVSVGNEAVLIKAPVNGFWSEWWTWEGADAEAITNNQLIDTLFASGAIPDVTISADTEANMQTALDAIASTVRPDVPLCITVEEVTGGGNLNLSADNITFNARAGLHVEYQGSGTLFWTNDNGSNATLGTSNVTFLNPFTLTLNDLQNPTEVRIYEAGTQNEVAGQESVTTGTFASTISVSSVDIRLLSLAYKISKLENIAISSDVTISVAQFIDRQYENPPGNEPAPQSVIVNFGSDNTDGNTSGTANPPTTLPSGYVSVGWDEPPAQTSSDTVNHEMTYYDNAGNSIGDLLDQGGSGWRIRSINDGFRQGWGWFNGSGGDLGATADGVDYDGDAIRHNWFTGNGTTPYYAELEIYNLTPNADYTLKMLGSNRFLAGTFNYTADSQTTGNIVGLNNTDDSETLTGVTADGSGVILVRCTVVSGYGYLNIMEITEE